MKKTKEREREHLFYSPQYLTSYIIGAAARAVVGALTHLWNYLGPATVEAGGWRLMLEVVEYQDTLGAILSGQVGWTSVHVAE